MAILWVFAVTSMGVYGIVLAGWSSNSKYSLLGALRSSAQMISYELSYGMALAAVLLLAGSMSIRDIVNAQAGSWLHIIPRWFVFLQPIGFFIFMTAGVAETNRAPFDFPEAEQELVAGYHTEYSSMSFAMFFLAEYINMVTVSAIATNLYLGGWHGPLLPEWLGWIWFLMKVSFLLFFYVWMRWTLPRYRYDQLMAFGWKFLLPLSVDQPARDRCRGALLWPLSLILFYAFAAVAVGTSLLVVVQSNPVYSVLLLIGSFIGLAGLYVLLDAPFVAVIQIIIYAGAIMVLFLFVVMLLNAPHEEPAPPGILESGATRAVGAAPGDCLCARAGVGAQPLARARHHGRLRHAGVVLCSRNRAAAVSAVRVRVRGDVDPDSRRHARRGDAGGPASCGKTTPWLSSTTI